MRFRRESPETAAEGGTRGRRASGSAQSRVSGLLRCLRGGPCSGPLLLLFALALTTRPAAAQTGALATEEADTGSRGSWTFETGFEAMAAEPSYLTGETRTRWDGPLLRLCASPAEVVEFDVEWVALVGASSEPSLPSKVDLGDLTLRAKLRFFRGGRRRPTVSGRFGIVLPETSYNDSLWRPLGLGPNTLRAFIEGLVTVPLGRTRLHGNVGLYLQDEVYRPHEQRDFVSFGVAAVHPVHSRAALLGEWAGRAGKSARGSPRQAEARVGVRLVRDRWQLDFVVRRGLVAAEGTWGAGASVSFGARARSL